MRPRTTSHETFARLFDLDCCHWHDDTTVILLSDALRALVRIRAKEVLANCAVTSPPCYGQRDYGVAGTIGMERDPQDFIDVLRDVFHELAFALKDNGSIWSNMRDTYGLAGARVAAPTAGSRRAGSARGRRTIPVTGTGRAPSSCWCPTGWPSRFRTMDGLPGTTTSG